MGKLFGTDGIRGIAGTELTCETGFLLGMAVASVLVGDKADGPHKRVLIGRDTRWSGEMFESALCAGLTKMGCDAVTLGVVPTPAVAYLIRQTGAEAGIMISASHNPATYNGLKVFGGEGYKLSDELEEKVEAIILSGGASLVPAEGAAIGRVEDGRALLAKYLAHLRSVVSPAGEAVRARRILFDLANGSASATAKEVFTPDLIPGWQFDFLSDQPDGMNINAHCGSTSLDTLKKAVTDGGYDMGIAFDGDADRCLAVNEKGETVNGDHLIAAFACELEEAGKLNGHTAVVTSLTNLGFHLMARERGIGVAVTDVGDRYVLEEMLRHDYKVGGEQSGHIILLDYGTTGDGQVTAAMILNLLVKYADRPASAVFAHMTSLPQVSLNVPVPNPIKKQIASDPAIASYVEARTADLHGEGRILLRPSGTEALVRIMLEGRDEAVLNGIAHDIADRIVGLIEK